MKPSILVVDDESTIRDTLRWALEADGYDVVAKGTGEDAVRLLAQRRFDAVVSDIRLPGIDGVEVLRRARAQPMPPLVVLITAYASVQTAVDALRHGAADYVLKPFSLDDFKGRIRRLLEGAIGVPGRGDDAVSDIVGETPAIQTVRQQVRRAATADSTVLIAGETGTGKDLVARAIHATSSRRAHRLVAVNCAAIPDALFESQLFGHARGAFTSAIENNPGLMVVADKGTLFLDEVGELPLPLQGKLLRAIEAKEVSAVGRTTPVRVDCRIVASSNRDLRREVEAGRFRADLYYRLKVVQVTVPPLRERRADIPLLVGHFLEQLNARLGRHVTHVEPDALRVLLAHDWKGNVRELQHVLESALVYGTEDRLTLSALPAELGDAAGDSPLKDATRQFERDRILEMLTLTGSDKRAAARLLGISLASLYRKLEPAGDDPRAASEN